MGRPALPRHGTRAPISPQANSADGSRSRKVLITCLAAGVALLGATFSEWMSAAAAVTLVVLGPTARRLDRRVAINIALTVGWAPFLMWIPPILGPRTASLALLTVALAATCAAAWRSSVPLLPEVRRRDALLAVSASIAALVALPMRSPGSPARAMRMLTGGWDHASHFSMYVEQRLSLAAPPYMPEAADASGFFFQDYAQWFHSLLVVLSQFFFGRAGTVDIELVRYTQLQWVVFVLVALLVSAAFLQALPRETPTSSLVLSMLLVWSLLGGVPGAVNLLQGHLSFLLAAASPAVILFLLLGRLRLTLATAAAVLGLIIVSASWLLVLPMAFVATLPRLRASWRGMGGTKLLALLAAAAAAVVASALLVSQSLGPAPITHVVLDGPVAAVGLEATVLVVVMTAAVTLWELRGSTCEASASRFAPLILVLAAGLQLAGLGAFQFFAAGALTYYFWKVALAVLLICVLVGTRAVVLAAMRPVGTQQRGRGPSRWMSAVLASVLAALGLGIGLRDYPSPSLWWAASMPFHLGDRADSQVGGDVDVILAMPGRTFPSDAARTTVIPTRPSDLSPAYGNQWFHALTRSRTVRAGELDDDLYELGVNMTDQRAIEIARAALSRPDGRVIVTDTGLLEALRSRLTPDEMERVTSIAG